MTPGCLFVALPGYKTDGHRYIRQALGLIGWTVQRFSFRKMQESSS